MRRGRPPAWLMRKIMDGGKRKKRGGGGGGGARKRGKREVEVEEEVREAEEERRGREEEEAEEEAEAGDKRKRPQQQVLSKYFFGGAATPKKTASSSSSSSSVIVLDADSEDESAAPKRRKAEAGGGAQRPPPPSFPLPERREVVLPDEFVRDKERSETFQQLVAPPAAASSSSSASSSSAPAASAQTDFERVAGVKYTPLEKQVLGIKEAHPDVILFVEVGYKYRLFASDAVVAAALLDMYLNPSGNFVSCSFPVHRLSIHLRRVVAAGHKAGVVNQTETAATKKHNKSSGTFERRLTEVVTAATMQDDAGEGGGAAASAGETRYVVCVADREADGAAAAARISLVAYDPRSGRVVWDSFRDGVLRAELDTRLEHLRPHEVLLPEGRVSDTTAAALRAHAASAAHRVRFETLAAGSHRVAADASRESVVDALAAHLRDFGLDAALADRAAFCEFAADGGAGRMTLDGVACRNLEVLRSQEGTRRGSLLWLVDRTLTRPGSREMERWLAAPLACADAVGRRQDAVDDLLRPGAAEWVADLRALLSRLPDLERGLARLQLRRSRPAEALALMARVRETCERLPDPALAASPLVRGLLEAVRDSGVAATAAALEAEFDPEAAERDDLPRLWRRPDAFPRLARCHADIAAAEAALRGHLEAARAALGKGYSSLEYRSVGGEEYLVEVRRAAAGRVPREWLQVCATKACVRYRPPEVAADLGVLERHRESLQAAARAAWREFQGSCAAHYAAFRGLVRRLAELDCLQALADVSAQPGYCRPRVVGGDARTLRVVGGRHPMGEVLCDGTAFVPNTVELGGGGARSLVVSGPNMGGKSSLIRMVALVSVMAQIGCRVPADEAEVSVLDAVWTRMGARDDLFAARSTFLVEMEETARVLRRATPRSLVILDELGRGTSTHDGTAIALATLEHLVGAGDASPLTLFVTHFPLVASVQRRYPARVALAHVSYARDEATGRLTFLYRLAPGMADCSYGLNVARLASVPEPVVLRAAEKGRQLERAVGERVARGGHALARRVAAVVEAGEAAAEPLRVLQNEAAEWVALAGSGVGRGEGEMK